MLPDVIDDSSTCCEFPTDWVIMKLIAQNKKHHTFIYSMLACLNHSLLGKLGEKTTDVMITTQCKKSHTVNTYLKFLKAAK